eukprot:scaffold23865_cov18-Tisochrysis_lutea.AAC.2
MGHLLYVVGPVVFTILVAVGALLLWLHSNRRKKHQTLWGASIPPKVRKATAASSFGEGGNSLPFACFCKLYAQSWSTNNTATDREKQNIFILARVPAMVFKGGPTIARVPSPTLRACEQNLFVSIKNVNCYMLHVRRAGGAPLQTLRAARRCGKLYLSACVMKLSACTMKSSARYWMCTKAMSAVQR